MNPEDFQSYVASGRLTQAQAKKLVELSSGAYCLHRSWGFGKVNSFDLTLGQVVIDFQQKKEHPMQFGYAADSLQVLPPEHLLALKAADPSALATRAEKNPAEVICLFARSFGEQAQIDRLESVLCGEVIPKDKWKKWIAAAKRAAKKEGLIVWPTKKNDPIHLLDRPETAADRLHSRLSKAHGLSDLLAVAEEVLKKVGKSEELKLLVPELVKSLDEQIMANRDKNPSVMVEAILIRDDLSRLGEMQAGVTSLQSVIQEVHNLHHLLSDLSSHHQRNTLEIIKQTFTDWETRVQKLIPTAGGKLLTGIVDFLIAEGKGDSLGELFQRLLTEQKANMDCMIWLCKNRENAAYAKWLPTLISGRFLAAMLTKMDAVVLETGGRRKNPLTELLLNDATLVADLVRASDAEEARDLGKSILASPAIEEIEKRSIMARLIKVSPSVQSLLVSKQAGKSEALIVSWESLERRKNEYDEIINKKIPENSREIAVARSYGDLRENHEFKAAKEMQTVLMRQKAELEDMLSRAHGTDFYKPDTSVVNIGTRVSIQAADHGAQETYSILGAWDSDPSQGIISYQTPLAKALLGKKVNEEVQVPAEQGERRVRVLNIEPAVMEAATAGGI